MEKLASSRTSVPGSQIRVPKTIKRNEVNFPENWYLENENHSSQINTQATNLDFVQKLADGVVKLSFDQSRFLALPSIIPPRLSSPKLLRDRSANYSIASSSRSILVRRDLNLELQGIKTTSKVSTPCYTAKLESVEYEEEN